jgi:hypothetical protein
MDTLGVLVRQDLLPGSTTLLKDAQTCFKSLRKATRLLMRHTRHLRRFKYGKALLRMFAKKPSVALKSILRASEGKIDTPTFPTNLSALRDENSGQLLTFPTEVITHLTHLETIALSPDSTLPPGAPFPWLGHVRPSSAPSDSMLIGQITPAIF